METLLNESANPQSRPRLLPNEPEPSKYDLGYELAWDQEIIEDERAHLRARLADVTDKPTPTNAEDGGGIVVRFHREARAHVHENGPITTQVDDGRTPVERLAAALGYERASTYRLLQRDLIPGAHKTDPSKKKSRFVIPDPEESARRFLAGERKEK
jgi:hypothetical protein